MQPTQLGPFKIRSRLGRGGMGTVYEAEDVTTGRAVAVKTLGAHLDDDASLRRRFEGEIEALKALRHPGIVQLLAFGEDDGQPYFAMELVRGRSLEEVLRSGRRFTWRETVAAALEVVRALKSAHDHGVIHRDLKPANLLLVDEPVDGGTIKLADFGIARLFGDGGSTLAGTVVGTADYMAPEQAAGRQVDHRADLYSLGLVMFAMMTGRPPFSGGEVATVLDRQVREPPPRLAARVADVPAELDALVDRLLAKDAARRPASALAVGRALEAIASLHADPAPAPPAADTVPSGTPAAAPPTDHDRASRPTLPSAHDLPKAVPAIDHEAATAAMPLPRTANATIPATGMPAPAAPATLPDTDRAAPTLTHPHSDDLNRAARSRFTTIEDLYRASQARDERVRRRQRLGQWAAAAAIVALLATTGYRLFRPQTADELHDRIRAIAADPDADLRDARSLIDRFLAGHPADPRADAIRDLDRTLDLDALEKRARRRPRTSRVLPAIERDYRAAMDREAESPAACVAALEAITVVHAGGDGTEDAALWLALARRQIERLGPLAAREREEDAARAAATLDEAAVLTVEAAEASDPARRVDLLARRRDLLRGLIEIHAARPHAAAAVAEARRLLAEEPEAAPARD